MNSVEIIKVSCDSVHATDLMFLSILGKIPACIAYESTKQEIHNFYFPRYYKGTDTNYIIKKMMPDIFA